jgi:predicted DsbA family dithiol-disulfide isomerase
MTKTRQDTIELFYTLTCPNCNVLSRMLKDILPDFNNRFLVKKTLLSGPVGYIRSLRMGIHSSPTLVINNEIVFRQVPSKDELIAKLKQYSNN